MRPLSQQPLQMGCPRGPQCGIVAAGPKIALCIATIVLATACGAATTHHPARPPVGAAVLTVGADGRIIPSGYLGLSLEYPAVTSYAGTDPGAVDPVFEQLVRNLTPGQAPVLRIGGDSTDWTWWPVPGLSRPAGAPITLTDPSRRVANALTQALGARVILGIDLEAGSARVASAEARALLSGVGRPAVAALELGNEPELYGSFTWDGSGRKGRPHGYDFAAFARDFSRIGAALPKLPLAGPATGAPDWFRDVGRFLAAEPAVQLVTLHRYPLQMCYINPRQPQYPTIPHLLSDRSSRGLADSVRTQVRTAHARRVQLRIDEMNTDSCGSDPHSPTFAAALWALDALFEFARVGVDGVNIHSYPRTTYELFSFSRPRGRWQGIVAPE